MVKVRYLSGYSLIGSNLRIFFGDELLPWFLVDFLGVLDKNHKNISNYVGFSKIKNLKKQIKNDLKIEETNEIRNMIMIFIKITKKINQEPHKNSSPTEMRKFEASNVTG